MMRLDILVTSSYYWPEALGNAPYVTGVAEHLAALGHRVSVATGFPHYPEWRSSARRRMASRELRNGVEIRRRWHYVPGRQSAGRRALYEASLFGFGLTALGRGRPDAIVGFVPSLASGLLAAAAARFHRRPYAIVFQDLIGLGAAQSGIGGGNRVAPAVQWIELAFARNAAAVGIIAEGFRPYLEGGGVRGAAIHRLRNWTQPTEPDGTVAETRARLGWRSRDFICLHAGNMGHKQGLDNLLDAASLLCDDGVRIVLAGDGNERSRLEQRARALGLGNVAFVDSQPAGRFEAMLQAADVLVVNQRASVSDMSLPSKLTSYFAAGRPIVAAVAGAGEAAREVEAAGAGLVVPPDVPEALRAAVLELKTAPAVAAALGASGTRYARTILRPAAALAGYERLLDRTRGARAAHVVDLAVARPPRSSNRSGTRMVGRNGR